MHASRREVPIGGGSVVNIYRARRYIKGAIITFIWAVRGIEIRDRVSVLGVSPHIAGKGNFRFGSRVSFRGLGSRSWFHARRNASLSIGSRSFINSGVTIDASVAVSIGKGCLIGDSVVIQDSNYHEVEEGAGVKAKAVLIGDNVWIGRNSIILPGVEIGDHSVIGAGSVVTKSAPPRSLVAGNPARIIREIVAPQDYIRF
ncbi:acyltransferase [Mesorhizobium sp.]|uniref:acyltransferase n=1 Tax=Mesorhizobium sp. TaxID=1871066 RepID=UPI000FE73ACF|nr:MAG: acyltransferase [Mesorhizobium sp.]TGT98701.1 acyltransferase [Mesorhizobium sp. M5C.F.Ca.ET.164.01.1.1]RWB33745.1 MAG: acyltransferase [Mesorhizobium sp.]RWB57421.1 MAG: acyltransferase [Mesorhizobium sp.]RWC22999.1 MAG: acyltransferase [Mesorhizobium sp.]